MSEHVPEQLQAQPVAEPQPRPEADSPWRLRAIYGLAAVVFSSGIGVGVHSGYDTVKEHSSDTAAEFVAPPSATAAPNKQAALHRTPLANLKDRPFPNDGHMTFVPAAPKAVAAVDRLLETPTNPDITNLWAEVSKRQTAQPDADREVLAEQRLYEIRNETAQEYNLDVYNAAPVVDVLEDNAKPEDSDMSARAYMATANAYLKKHGVKVAIDRNVPYEYNEQPATMKDVSSNQGRTLILSLVRAIAAQPRQYSDMLGIRRYLLTRQKPHTEATAAAYIQPALSKPPGKAVVLNISTAMDDSRNRDVVNHEQQHRVDFLQSGGTTAFDVDPGYEDASRNIPYGLTEKPTKQNPSPQTLAQQEGWLTKEDYNVTSGNLMQEMQPKYGQPDCKDAAEQADAQLNEAGSLTVLASHYAGEDSVSEQRAETGMVITQGDKYVQFLDPHLPSLREQLKLLLARGLTYRPRIYRYFMAMATKPSQDYHVADQDPQFFEHMCDQAVLNIKGGVVEGGK